MLCLSRNFGEAIVIAGNVKVTVLKGRRGDVMLGIEAPQEVPVHREEVAARAETEKAA